MGKRKSGGNNGKSKQSSPPFDALPGSLLESLGGLSDQEEDHSPEFKAQDLIYDAWENEDPAVRAAKAREALEIWPDCADAYVLLADETAQTSEETLSLYREGVAAGKRALGQDFFDNEVGYFWGFLESRPYMRARHRLAEALWDAGQHEEAVTHYNEMLRLNPNDNQGIRSLLMPCLIEIGRDQEAELLFEQYKGDDMAVWMFSRALLDFRRHGDSASAIKSLKSAIKQNGHVPAYLLGRQKMPRYLPDMYGYGDEPEAVLYTYGNRAAWEATSGALEWLGSHV